MKNKASFRDVQRDIAEMFKPNSIVRHRAVRRKTLQARAKLMTRVARKIFDEYHVRPAAWEREHLEWLWAYLDREYKEGTAYVYKTVARNIYDYYVGWTFKEGVLEIVVPEA